MMSSPSRFSSGIGILFTLTASLLIACGSASETGNAETMSCLSGSTLIKVPTSATVDTAEITENQLPLEKVLYENVRGYIWIADELVHNESFGLITLLNLYRDSLPWDDIEREHLKGGRMNNTRWVATYSEDDEYHYGVQIYLDSAGKELPVFSLLFNGNFAVPRGEAYYRIDLIEPDIDYPLCIEVAFSDSSGKRTLDISAVSEHPISGFYDGFRKLYLQLFETNDVLHISGASYHPYIPDLLPDTTEYCVDFFGYSDMAANRSLLYIAVPPADIDRNDPELFTTYSLSSLLLRHVIKVDVQQYNDTLKQYIVTSYTDSLPLSTVRDSVEKSGTGWLRPADEIASMTLDDLDRFFECNQPTSDEYILDLMRLRQITQPFYFDKNGYIDNGLAPDGFSALAATPRILDIQSPYTVKMIRIIP